MHIWNLINCCLVKRGGLKPNPRGCSTTKILWQGAHRRPGGEQSWRGCSFDNPLETSFVNWFGHSLLTFFSFQKSDLYSLEKQDSRSLRSSQPFPFYNLFHHPHSIGNHLFESRCCKFQKPGAQILVLRLHITTRTPYKERKHFFSQQRTSKFLPENCPGGNYFVIKSIEELSCFICYRYGKITSWLEVRVKLKFRPENKLRRLLFVHVHSPDVPEGVQTKV